MSADYRAKREQLASDDFCLLEDIIQDDMLACDKLPTGRWRGRMRPISPATALKAAWPA